MPLWSLTKERVEKLRRQIGDKEMEVDELIKLSKEDLWKKDLDDFLAEWRFQLEDEDRREKKMANLGRRTSNKLKTAGRGPASKKRKAGDDGDGDFAAPKSKKAATTAKHVKPQGGLLDYLNQGPSQKKAKGKGFDAASDSDDIEPEVLPQKKSARAAAAAKKPEPAVQNFNFTDSEDDLKPTAPPQKASEEARESAPAPAKKDSPIEVLSELDDAPPEEAVPLPAKGSKARGTAAKAAPKSATGKAKAAPEPASESEKPAAPAKKAVRGAQKGSKAAKTVEPSESEDAVAESAPRQSRANRQPMRYDEASLSDSDNGDELGDVSQMVKGIGGTTSGNVDDSRALFSELSRPGSGNGPRSASKAQKSDAQNDETDYSKLVPSKSPRRSIVVKPKDAKAAETDDDDDGADDNDNDGDDEPVPAKSTAAKASTAKTGAKPGPKGPKSTATSSRSKAQKPAPKAAPAPKKPVQSPAAKAYASKKTKASTALADDGSDKDHDDDGDDIDAMANDILDSPPATKKSAPAAARPSRRAATTAKKPAYTFEADSDEDDFDGGGGASSEDDSYDIE